MIYTSGGPGQHAKQVAKDEAYTEELKRRREAWTSVPNQSLFVRLSIDSSLEEKIDELHITGLLLQAQYAELVRGALLSVLASSTDAGIMRLQRQWHHFALSTFDQWAKGFSYLLFSMFFCSPEKGLLEPGKLASLS